MPVEILAPIGAPEALPFAVRAGADAVYLGLGQFNARRNAENFDDGAFMSAVGFCHTRNVKVYLTLNTLVADSEFADALRLATFAASCGVDAFIVQDLGLARVLHTVLPEVPLHASTQMSVLSPAGLPLLKALGFCRVVVPRECSKALLKEFCDTARSLQMEVEAFVHGAHCMSVSGQCYLSSMLGGRSGNRGLCAQPCRLPFAAQGGTGFDLSLRDLSLLDHLQELQQMGVTSFKIEGRMKRPEYVAAATLAVKQALNGTPDPKLQQLLTTLFSRNGFSAGYYKNATGKEMFGVRTKESTEQFKAALAEIHTYVRTERQSVPLQLQAEISADAPCKLTLFDGTNTVTVTGEPPQAAKNAPTEEGAIQKQLSKLGGTPYYAQRITVGLGQNLFVPAAVLNDLRRRGVEALTACRSAVQPPKPMPYVPAQGAPQQGDMRLVLRLQSATQLPEDITGVAAVVLPIDTDFSALPPLPCPVLAELPRGNMFCTPQLAEQLSAAKQNGIKAALCGNLAAMALCQQVGLAPVADFGMNVYNTEALQTLKALGAGAATVSFECPIGQITDMPHILPLGVIVYGHLPLMLMRNCPNKNGVGCAACQSPTLTDRRGEQFPLQCKNGFTELLNCVPLWLADRLGEWNCDYAVLYFTGETKPQVTKVLEDFKTQAAPNGRYTRGLYYRTVL